MTAADIRTSTRAWRELRAAWEQHLVNLWSRGRTYPCLLCGQPIGPEHAGKRWHLAHHPDAPEIFGGQADDARPAHANCNLSESKSIADEHQAHLKAISAAAEAIDNDDPFLEQNGPGLPRESGVSAVGGGRVPDYGPREDDAVWLSVPWVAALLPVPENATWPRYMTVPHPDAVGSFGDEFIAWAEDLYGPLRWFQKLIAVRILEHDASGHLVWDVVIWTMARQLGKSWLLRLLLFWRIQPEQAERFGEPQTIVHTAKDLDSANECQMPVRMRVRECSCGGTVWVDVAGRKRNGHSDECAKIVYHTSEKTGEFEVRHVPTLSRWMVRSQNAVYGKGSNVGAVDEAWKVKPTTVDDGLEPTQAERSNPQLYLISTAHRKATALMITRRQDALRELEEPVSTLIIEWSMWPGMAVDDPQAWRAASPHWTPQRERIVRRKLNSALRGDVVEADPDEPDPMQSFQSQWLNIWPTPQQGGPGKWLPKDAWVGQPMAPRPEESAAAQVVLAVEGTYLRRVSVVGSVLGTGAVFHVWTQNEPSNDEVWNVLMNACTLWDVQEIVHDPTFRKKLFTRIANDDSFEWPELVEWDSSLPHESAATGEMYRAIEGGLVPHDHHPVITAHQLVAVGRVGWQGALRLVRPLTGEAADAAIAARNAWWRAVQLSDERVSDDDLHIR